MKELPDDKIEKIISLLEKGKPLPEHYKDALISDLKRLKTSLLFDTKKEYELIYADKEREEDILADTMAVPLQRVKTFHNGDGTVPDLRSEARRIGTVPNSWTNMLIFGDNLQILKTLLQMKEKGRLKNADGTPGVRLIYIDPPFATRQEFRGSQDQKAYQDKIAGARFLEFLRKRLVFLRELLSEDGSIYVHLDYKKGHYAKVLLDEILGEQNLRNEIIVRRTQKNFIERDYIKSLNIAYDSILFYLPNSDGKIKPPYREEKKEETWHAFDAPNWAGTRPNLWYELFGHLPPQGSCWRWTKERAEKAIKEGRLRPNPTTGRPEYLVPAREKVLCTNLWDDINAYSFSMDYPTEKNEKLLMRIVEMSSNPGDLVLDCFAGSGTTLAVAEKLGRRWIGVDCGKLAIYTMQKRLLNIAESKDLENPKKKYGKQCKPFTLYNAGLYDYRMIKELPWEQYRDFALKLFQCRDEKHEISKIELDGYLGADSVLVFNYQKYKDAVMDRGFIDDLHKYLGDKIGKRFFIIAPAASVQFLEDYIQKGKSRYYVLRIPYSIIEEIHNRGFTKIKQPVSEMDVNDTVDAVGFDFIQVPTVECKYYLEKPKNPDLLNQKTKECVIKIEKFMSKIISRKPVEYENLETLSMVMLDYDFNGEVFDLDEVFYAEDLKKNGYEVRFDSNKIVGVNHDSPNQIMIIYIDIFGNEKREVKTSKDFKK